jgi:hypothetical protein
MVPRRGVVALVGWDRWQDLGEHGRRRTERAGDEFVAI